jgi:N-acetylneuraminic acid mutarotase
MKSPRRLASIALSAALVVIVSGCGGGSPQTQPPPRVSTWTWVSGANGFNQDGMYGTQGTASPANVPGARSGAASWMDNSGNLWLFGGLYETSNTATGGLSDLWKFDGTNWTWVSGPNMGDQPGVYGTLGQASPSNVPGARSDSISWTGSGGIFWLFGGFGNDFSVSNSGNLNDLWKFDGTNWTWVSGANIADQLGVYGAQGVPSASNVPGGRQGGVSWIDHAGNLWLFGGYGRDSTAGNGRLNDLWKFDGTNWTWVSGANIVNQPGVYGTKGMPSSSNVPGARNITVSWIDGSGNFWLFGGFGIDSAGTTGRLNDLWKFDGSNWTWVSGANVVNQPGVYGAGGTASSSNAPGARSDAVARIDNTGAVWLFGGLGVDSAGTTDVLNDLWKFDGNNWTWVSGAITANQTGRYGTKGTASKSNAPGSRASSAAWVDKQGSLWLFGGVRFDFPPGTNEFNDLWRFTQ